MSFVVLNDQSSPPLNLSGSAVASSIASSNPHRGIHRYLPSLDVAGAVASSLCAIHCALLPLVLIILPSLASSEHSHDSLLGDFTFEMLFVCISISIATFSLLSGLRVHGRHLVLLVLPVAAGILAYVHIGHESLSPLLHGMLSATAGIILAAGHLVNRKLCIADCHKACCHQHE